MAVKGMMASLAFLVSIAPGCTNPDAFPVAPPRPLAGANAVWRDPVPQSIDVGAAKTVLVVKTTSLTEFARREGRNWNQYWYDVQAEVVSVTKGAWTAKTLRLAWSDSWPRPESGIMIDKPLPPFVVGKTVSVALDEAAPPRVIGWHP